MIGAGIKKKCVWACQGMIACERHAKIKLQGRDAQSGTVPDDQGKRCVSGRGIKINIKQTGKKCRII